jgi:CBS domain-containing protein
VFTERDLTRRILDRTDVLDVRLGDVMSSPVVSTRPDVEVAEAFDLMNERNVRRLVVVADGSMVGIVTERDLMRWVGAVSAE